MGVAPAEPGMPERHSRPARPSSTVRATTPSHGSPPGHDGARHPAGGRPLVPRTPPAPAGAALRAHAADLEPDGRARPARVADHEVRAAREEEDGIVARRRQRLGQLRLAVHVQEPPRRPAEAQRGEGGERDVVLLAHGAETTSGPGPTVGFAGTGTSRPGSKAPAMPRATGHIPTLSPPPAL